MPSFFLSASSAPSSSPSFSLLPLLPSRLFLFFPNSFSPNSSYHKSCHFFFFGSCHVSKYISQKRIVKLPTLLSPSLKFNWWIFCLLELLAPAGISGRLLLLAKGSWRPEYATIRCNFTASVFPLPTIPYFLFFFLLLLLLFLPFILISLPLYPSLWRLYAHATSIYEM